LFTIDFIGTSELEGRSLSESSCGAKPLKTFLVAALPSSAPHDKEILRAYDPKPPPLLVPTKSIGR
jgi:hypothetical protein